MTLEATESHPARGWPDPRLQLGFVILALVVIISRDNLKIPLLFTGFSLVAAWRRGIKASEVSHRLAALVMMAVVVVVTQLFFYGQTPLFHIELGPWALTGYVEGWRRGCLLTLRMTAGVSLMLYLSATAPMYRLTRAVRWLRVPEPLVEMLEMSYRYTFVLWEEAISARQAQKARLGYAHWRVGLQSGAYLGGSLLIRAFDRGERIYRSMCCRCYRDRFYGTREFSLTRADAKQAAMLLAMLVAAVLLG